MIHELTHVWQFEVTGPFYMSEAIHAQVARGGLQLRLQGGRPQRRDRGRLRREQEEARCGQDAGFEGEQALKAAKRGLRDVQPRAAGTDHDALLRAQGAAEPAGRGVRRVASRTSTWCGRPDRSPARRRRAARSTRSSRCCMRSSRARDASPSLQSRRARSRRRRRDSRRRRPTALAAHRRSPAPSSSRPSGRADRRSAGCQTRAGRECGASPRPPRGSTTGAAASVPSPCWASVHAATATSSGRIVRLLDESGGAGAAAALDGRRRSAATSSDGGSATG